jgi:hypothetical protein
LYCPFPQLRGRAQDRGGALWATDQESDKCPFRTSKCEKANLEIKSCKDKMERKEYHLWRGEPELGFGIPNSGRWPSVGIPPSIVLCMGLRAISGRRLIPTYTVPWPYGCLVHIPLPGLCPISLLDQASRNAGHSPGDGDLSQGRLRLLVLLSPGVWEGNCEITQKRAKVVNRLCGAYLLRQRGGSGRAHWEMGLEGFHSRKSHPPSLGCVYDTRGGLIP